MEEYKKDVERLRELGRQWNMTEKEIDKVIKESIDFFEVKKQNHRNGNFNFLFPVYLWRLFASLSFLIIIMFSLIVYRKSVQNIVERNVQEIIYPGMKLFRKLMLPVVKTFPSLTEWYDENCLVRNPYFQVVDMDCWPCSNIRSILNLTGSDLASAEYHSGIPFIYKEDQIKHVHFSDLKKMYESNRTMFDKHSPRILVSGSGSSETIKEFLLTSPPDVFPSEKKDTHVIWKLIRLEPTRAARHLFGFPRQSPYYTSGTAPEKFIIVDEPHAPPYLLPTTEGSTVFVVQSGGSRLLVLDPAPECQSDCHRVSLVLEHRHILWYNWWYWRASSFPLMTSKEMSITYVGSYY